MNLKVATLRDFVCESGSYPVDDYGDVHQCQIQVRHQEAMLRPKGNKIIGKVIFHYTPKSILDEIHGA